MRSFGTTHPTPKWALLAPLWLVLSLLCASFEVSATPISSTPSQTFVGFVDYVGTGNTLRTAADGVDACAVTGSSSANLTGIPVGATVERAFLYWAGSGATPDFTVTFNGLSVSADQQYTENFAGTFDFFSGSADVTSQVSGNGNFTFSGLNVDNDAPFCAVSGVLAGWALVVIYSDPAEPFRTINLFEGFQVFRGSSFALSPSNFVIPGSSVDGRLGILSWEGDAGNSGVLGGVSETLLFDGQNTAPIALIDSLNPTNNQYNSTINISGSSDVFGVDFDIYDISPHLTAGDTAASTTYSSGQDLVLLSLEIISVTNTPATDLALNKSTTGGFVRGGTGDFVLRVDNLGPLTHNDVVTVVDTLPAGFTFSAFTSADPLWSCTGTSTVTCIHSGSNLLVGDSLPEVTVTVDVAADLTGIHTNSAVVSSNVFDPLIDNNTATADAAVLDADLSTSTKTVLDLDSGLVLAGDLLEFSIDVVDLNNSQTVVTVTDTLSSLLTNLTVVDTAGGTDFTSGSSLDIRDIPVPAGASTTIVFTAEVVATASLGNIVSNTATITDQLLGTTMDVSSLDLSVGDTSGPGSGTKQLYLDNVLAAAPTAGSPLTMSRVALTSVSSPIDRLRIRRQDNSMIWSMNPVTAATLSLDASAIPVRLLMRRNANATNRNVRVSLSYSGAANGFIGCADRTLTTSDPAGLSSSVTREFIFSVPRTDADCNSVAAAPINLPPGTAIEMHIDNQPGGTSSGQAIEVFPFDALLGNSQLELPATTVINVDSLEFFSAPFPGGLPLTSTTTGDTVYIRSVVSDPFGSADITDAQLTITNSTGTLLLTQDLDPSGLVASDAATKTYEHAYSVPSGGPLGTWVAAVTALEGNEGTISHTRQSNIEVGLTPVITLVKNSLTASDPLGGANPKSIPGAVVQFSIAVHNLGPGNADPDSIVVVDTLPSEARLLFATPSMDPLIFVNGPTASGLTYNFISLGSTGDDIEFSNDGGASTITPLVDPTTGLDLTVPRINHLRVNPKGTLVPSATGPSFTLRLLMQID